MSLILDVSSIRTRLGCWVENLYGFAPNALAWVDPLGLYGYYELYKNGKLVYRGITERKVIERIMEHALTAKILMMPGTLKT